MATNKPHFRLTTYGKLNPGDLAVELHWAIPEAVKIKSIITHEAIMTITLTNGTWMIRRPTDKCLASWQMIYLTACKPSIIFSSPTTQRTSR